MLPQPEESLLLESVLPLHESVAAGSELELPLHESLLPLLELELPLHESPELLLLVLESPLHDSLLVSTNNPHPPLSLALLVWSTLVATVV